MAGSPLRRFTIADLMIFVAAAAAGLMIQRLIRREIDAETPRSHYTAFWYWSSQASPLVLACPVALLISRAIPPRPRARALFRQPGTMACLSVVCMWMLDVVISSMQLFSSTLDLTISFYFNTVLYSGHTVVLTWGVMALARIWRPEATWIDRAGRGLGIMLIILWIGMRLSFLYL